MTDNQSGGAVVAEVLARNGVQFLFTLCGGHISPILIESRKRNIRVVDVRDEKNAVFAADAVARMTGIPGVAAVTAGPGVTNTLTAIKNAQMAQSPVILLGGAAATILKGRGALQDIDQLSLMRPLTKWATSVSTRAQLPRTMERAFEEARSGVPGPVFVELPIDLLYDEQMVREWYIKESGVKDVNTFGAKVMRTYLEAHLMRQFKAPAFPVDLPAQPLHVPPLNELAAHLPLPPRDTDRQINDVVEQVRQAKRPVLVVGSQALVNSRTPEVLAASVSKLGIPVYLGGSARGLLGRHHPVQFRHARGKALKEADLVIVAGFPFDFRLGYGRSIGRKATLVAANLSAVELRKNRRPEIAVRMHPGELLNRLAEKVNPGEWGPWIDQLKAREAARDAEILKQSTEKGDLVNPIAFFLRLEEKLEKDAVLVVDGGDFVATGAYVLRPRAPLSWLDPGVFGTLGVGGGFAAGAALVNPKREVWLIYGDGSSAYSLSEFDTFVRHGLAPIAVIGNDGAWAQIAREQVEIFGDDVATVLRRSDYHKVAEGYGGVGLVLTDPAKIDATIDEAKRIAREGKPVCINVHLARSDFRKGSISM
ncbi:MAG: thiamine pyrophosphate-binding protein [Myxococcaceae bacterium]